MAQKHDLKNLSGLVFSKNLDPRRLTHRSMIDIEEEVVKKRLMFRRFAQRQNEMEFTAGGCSSSVGLSGIDTELRCDALRSAYTHSR